MGTFDEIEVAMIANDETIFRDTFKAKMWCQQRNVPRSVIHICFEIKHVAFLNSLFLSSSSELLELAVYKCYRQTDDSIWWKATSTALEYRMYHVLTTKHYITLDFLFFVLKDFRSIAEHSQTLPWTNVIQESAPFASSWACVFRQR